MYDSQLSFELHHTDAGSAARASTLRTPHGDVQLPAFMPVATQGTVKGLEIDQVRRAGAQIVLSNTYHLALRPGEDVVRDLGGLHQMMGWNGPILTDSGGFQIFSLARITQVTDQAASFRSHIDGSLLELTPERVVQIQSALGSDIAMVLDDVRGLPADAEALQDACRRTLHWAQRSRDMVGERTPALFAIVQGGLLPELRLSCAEQLVAMDFPGYAIGGLSVGESPEQMYDILDVTCPALPVDRPRYLMGVGRPQDLLEAIRRGIDLFDCVMPTRNGRNATAFTDEGLLKMRNARHERDDRPLDQSCPCVACSRSRGYLRHLFIAGEMLGPILLSIHNLTYYLRLMDDARAAIQEDQFSRFFQEKMRGWVASVDRESGD